MALECVETAGPHRAVRLEPRVDLGEWLCSQLVPTSLRIGPNHHEARVSEYPQVLGHTGLTEAGELHELPHHPRTLPQQIEDPPPGGLDQHIERGRGRHALSMPYWLYACQGMHPPVIMGR